MNDPEMLETEEVQVNEEELVDAPVEATQIEGPRIILKRSGAETDEVFAVTDGAIIGRFDPNVGPVDIDLGSLAEAVYISRKHATLSYEEDSWKLTDLGSSNGTFILRGDFERVETCDLEDGTEFALGNARFVFKV
ncbi:MAG: FHA domain-containing protein [Fimbriimonadaceae bacterium]